MATVLAANLFGAESGATATRGMGLEPLPASGEGEAAMKKFQLPAGFKIELFAAEPMLANPVAFSIDERGRVFVAETYRHSAVGPAFRFYEGVFDIRSHMDWLEDDLASRSVADRVQLLRQKLGANFASLTNISERIRLLEDRNHDGKADFSTVFADNFKRAADGIGAGILARHGDVFYTCIPDLYLLRDQNGDGKADFRQSLHTGFGVHIAFLGHDLHGLRLGPDGRLYFSVGDRGLNVTSREGKRLIYPDEGTILRCELDGSNLEVFARGLRNPQELAFDEFGNLFTGDNNSDGGDRARWVYVVEGGDSGWRIGYQTLNGTPRRGPWNGEGLWHPQFENQPAFIVPPVANLGYGPSGVTYYPGTGLPERYKGHFFLCDFRGGGSSGIHSFDLKQKGASFELAAYEQFIWETLPTDVEFGIEGGIYFSDWVEGWNKTGKGRIYRAFDPSLQDPAIAETKQLLAGDFSKFGIDRLRQLMGHPDQRVRMEAQFTVAAMGEQGASYLASLSMTTTNRLAARHAVWGLGQLSRRGVTNAQFSLLFATKSADSEIRAQAAKALGETSVPQSGAMLLQMLNDPEPRVKCFAAISLGRLKYRSAQQSLYSLLDQNQNRDPILRHAAVAGLEGIADRDALKAAASNPSKYIRLGACLALRRLEDSGVAAFLNDPELSVRVEAARAINDLPIAPAMPQLAGLIANANLLSGTVKTNAAARHSGIEAGISAVSVDTGLTPVPEQLFLRVINANYRVGHVTNAQALAEFAANKSNPATLRAGAVAALADWSKASGRDRITGLWRPIPMRDGAPARAALSESLESLLKEPVAAIQSEAIHAAKQLAIKDAAPTLVALASGNANPVSIRVEALKALASIDAQRLKPALDAAFASGDATLQAEAIQLEAELDPAAAIVKVKRQLGASEIPAQRSALNALGILKLPEADEIMASWLDRLNQKQVPRELALDVLEAAGKRSSREVLDRVQRFEAARPRENPFGPFAECLYGGDPAAGKKIFFERAEVFCSRCHQMNGEGGEAGPKLTGVGGRNPREYLLESIIFPNNKIATGWENVVVTMKDGRSYAGKVTKESETQLFLNSPEDGDLTLTKSNIKNRTRALSAMPDEFRQILTKQELRDLVEFLASSK